MNGWVLIDPEPRQDVSSGGVILSETYAHKVGHSTGVVVSCPDTYYPNKVKTSKPCVPPVCVGDRVVYRDYLKEIEAVTSGGKTLCFIHMDDLLLVAGESTDVRD
jgi:co-chaperonin GroES (HSP10)